MIQSRQLQSLSNKNQQIEKQGDSSQSFYSLDNSKCNFTFEQPLQQVQTKVASNKIVKILGLKQSSALHQNDFSSNELNQSMHTIVVDEQVEVNLVNDAPDMGMNLHDISGIDHKEVNELECSMCLQKEIDCLSLPNQMTPEQIQQLNNKMDRLKQEQSLLMRQMEVFRGIIDLTKHNNEELVKQVMQANNFIKKKCEHESNMPFSIPQNISVKSQKSQKTLKQSKTPNNPVRIGFKHYDIKPAKTRSASEEQMNFLYKSATFEGKITLINDTENQYRVQVIYDRNNVTVEVINYTKGIKNFVYAAKFNQESQENSQRISEKLQFPLQRYMSKKFTLSLNILLLIFAQNLPKQQQNLIKIEEIRTISIPLPLNYFIQPRFYNVTQADKEALVSKIRPKMFTYEIDINYNADLESFKKLKETVWIKNQWFSLKGSKRLLYLQLCQVQQKENLQRRVVFRVAVKEKDAQQAVDMIEFLCFMLAL